MEPQLLWSRKQLVSERQLDKHYEYVYAVPFTGDLSWLLFLKLQRYFDKQADNDVVTYIQDNDDGTLNVRALRPLPAHLVRHDQFAGLCRKAT